VLNTLQQVPESGRYRESSDIDLASIEVSRMVVSELTLYAIEIAFGVFVWEDDRR